MKTLTKKFGICVIVLIFLFSGSCEYIAFTPQVTSAPVSNFYYLWDKVDKQYAYFDVKNVDWGSVYAKYADKIHKDLTDDSLFYYLGSMLNELRDGHVNLFSDFNISRYDIALLGKNNYNSRLIKDHYLGSNYYTTGPFHHDHIAEGKAGYVRYGSFSGNFSDENVQFILQRYKTAEGLIIDMRQNGGGYISNMYKLLSHLSVSDSPVFTTSIKSGPDHDEFSAPQDVHLSPYDSVLTFTKPVAVLIDRGSFSATSLFALAALSLDNIFLVGDTTGGGLGMPNGGQLPNGWTYRFSITRTLTPDGINYENGIPPDIYSILLDSDMARGYDSIIETALDSILNR